MRLLEVEEEDDDLLKGRSPCSIYDKDMPSTSGIHAQIDDQAQSFSADQACSSTHDDQMQD